MKRAVKNQRRELKKRIKKLESEVKRLSFLASKQQGNELDVVTVVGQRCITNHDLHYARYSPEELVDKELIKTVGSYIVENRLFTKKEYETGFGRVYEIRVEIVRPKGDETV